MRRPLELGFIYLTTCPHQLRDFSPLSSSSRSSSPTLLFVLYAVLTAGSRLNLDFRFEAIHSLCPFTLYVQNIPSEEDLGEKDKKIHSASQQDSTTNSRYTDLYFPPTVPPCVSVHPPRRPSSPRCWSTMSSEPPSTTEDIESSTTSAGQTC